MALPVLKPQKGTSKEENMIRQLRFTYHALAAAILAVGVSSAQTDKANNPAAPTYRVRVRPKTTRQQPTVNAGAGKNEAETRYFDVQTKVTNQHFDIERPAQIAAQGGVAVATELANPLQMAFAMGAKGFFGHIELTQAIVDRLDPEFIRRDGSGRIVEQGELDEERTHILFREVSSRTVPEQRSQVSALEMKVLQYVSEWSGKPLDDEKCQALAAIRAEVRGGIARLSSPEGEAARTMFMNVFSSFGSLFKASPSPAPSTSGDGPSGTTVPVRPIAYVPGPVPDRTQDWSQGATVAEEVENLVKEAMAGKAEALCELGFLLIRGSGINKTRGAALVLKAAEQGHTIAQKWAIVQYAGVADEQILPLDCDRAIYWAARLANDSGDERHRPIALALQLTHCQALPRLSN